MVERPGVQVTGTKPASRVTPHTNFSLSYRVSTPPCVHPPCTKEMNGWHSHLPSPPSCVTPSPVTLLFSGPPEVLFPDQTEPYHRHCTSPNLYRHRGSATAFFPFLSLRRTLRMVCTGPPPPKHTFPSIPGSLCAPCTLPNIPLAIRDWKTASGLTCSSFRSVKVPHFPPPRPGAGPSHQNHQITRSVKP